MATTIQETGRRVALCEIRVPENVRDLDPEHVKALAGSITLTKSRSAQPPCAEPARSFRATQEGSRRPGVSC